MSYRSPLLLHSIVRLHLASLTPRVGLVSLRFNADVTRITIITPEEAPEL